MSEFHTHTCEQEFDFECFQEKDGALTFVINNEYSASVNFCPWCGYKSPKPQPFKKTGMINKVLP